MADGLDLGNLVIHLKADIAQYEREMKRAKDLMNKQVRSMTSAGIKMSLAVTVPLTIIAKKSVSAFASFDEAMTNSTAIMRNLAPAMRAEMEAVARTLSTQSVTSANDLAKAYEFLALAGLDAKTSIAALPKVNQFAIAGAFDMATATDLLTDAQDALRMSSKDTNVHIANMAHIADSVAFAATQANDSIQGFATMLTRDAGVAAATLNMELKTTLAILSAYASQGIKGARAGNMFGRATRLLTKAARENGAVWKKVGVDVINQTTGEYRNFINILGDLEKIMVRMTAPERAALLDKLGFAALAQKSILPLIGMTDKMRDYEAALADVTGTTAQIANNQQKSFNAELAITKNMLTDAAISIGQTLAPAIGWLNDQLRVAIKWWNALSDRTRKYIIATAVVVAAIGPMLLVIAALIKGVLFLVATFGVFGNVLAAVAAAAAGWTLGKYLVGQFEWIAQAGNDLASALFVVWEYIKFGFSSMVAGIVSAWDWLMEKITGDSRDIGKTMFEDAQKELEKNLQTIGEANVAIKTEIEEKFAQKRADERKKEEEDALAAAEAAANRLADKLTLDDLGLGGDDGGLTQFGTGEAIGQLGFAGLTSGAENILENLQKQQLNETKKQTDHLAGIEENTEWA